MQCDVDTHTKGSVEPVVVEAQQRGVDVDYDAARERVYGMPYDIWKAEFQGEATPQALQQFDASGK